jgi:hypothetical protein
MSKNAEEKNSIRNSLFTVIRMIFACVTMTLNAEMEQGGKTWRFSHPV